MSQSVQGQISNGCNLTTTFSGGTAGEGKEVNNFSGLNVSIGPNEDAGRRFVDFWSHTYSAVSVAFDLDLTALPGIGGRTVTLSALRYLRIVNSDPTAGHDIAASPGASNGLAAIFGGTSPSVTVHGGMPGASVDTNGKPTGNDLSRTFCHPAGITVDSTHKVLTFTPTGTVTSVTVFLGG